MLGHAYKVEPTFALAEEFPATLAHYEVEQLRRFLVIGERKLVAVGCYGRIRAVKYHRYAIESILELLGCRSIKACDGLGFHQKHVAQTIDNPVGIE